MMFIMRPHGRVTWYVYLPSYYHYYFNKCQSRYANFYALFLIEFSIELVYNFIFPL